ncbi:hypothetical protein HHI36_011554 [Cryptolaemus montrouzieri]|uniref:Uncharacterized protein n=1 Tax=Cryptolaemus montrouzieri TaxID=559131 RepID=A0ABD2MM18_9CUCU
MQNHHPKGDNPGLESTIEMSTKYASLHNSNNIISIKFIVHFTMLMQITYLIHFSNAEEKMSIICNKLVLILIFLTLSTSFSSQEINSGYNEWYEKIFRVKGVRSELKHILIARCKHGFIKINGRCIPTSYNDYDYEY